MLHIPGERLTTQNLILSAASAFKPRSANWESVHDLCALIDMVCMYDSISVLGRPEYLEAAVLAPAINRVVKVAALPPMSMGRVRSAAQKHLDAYVGSLGNTFTATTFAREHAHPVFRHSAVYHPLQELSERLQFDQEDHANVRQAVVRALSSAERPPPFIVRSFLYTGYADVRGLVFVPDSARAVFMSSIVESEFELRAKLLAAMEKGAGHTRGPATSPLRRVSALASVVFERSNFDLEHLVPELLKLRDELTPLRDKLRVAETRMLYGRGAEPLDVGTDWKLIAEEIERTYGAEPHLISVNGIMSLGHSMSELADEPLKAKSWMNALLGLPFDVAKRLMSRQPAIELHRIHKEQPAAGRLMNAISKMFGDVW